jgi:signal transduction histidine kinase
MSTTVYGSASRKAPAPLERMERWPRPAVLLLAFVILLVVAVADYLTGVELSFSIFYLVAISLTAWFVGRGAGILVSIISVTCWLAGDLAAGALYSSHFVPWWNAVITLSFYFAMVTTLSSLRKLHRELEARVRERTSALSSEIAERERLEKALLSVSEREQRRIGHDLHDTLCQHLLATALSGQVLAEKLSAKSQAEAADAVRLVRFIEDGIEMARNIARGLAPIELNTEGLMDAFRELARTTSERFKINCRFEPHGCAILGKPEIAENLFRIAQEAVTNAVKHGRAQNVTISLTADDSGDVELGVRDDGGGLPEAPPAHRGMGLGIMRHRAAMIGAQFDARRINGGSLVTCRTGTHGRNVTTD